MSKLICPICNTQFGKSLFNVKIPNNGILNCKEFEGMTPVCICKNCVSGLMTKNAAYFDAFLNSVEDEDLRNRLASYIYSSNAGINKLEEERKKYSISNCPIATFDYFNNKITIYPVSVTTGYFMIVISHGGYYVLNAKNTVFIDSKNDVTVDGSQVEKALMLGLTGHSFLGYAAATAAKVYDVVEEVSVTLYDALNDKKALIEFAPKNQKMTPEVYADFSAKVIAFMQTLADIIGK